MFVRVMIGMCCFGLVFGKWRIGWCGMCYLIFFYWIGGGVYFFVVYFLVLVFFWIFFSEVMRFFIGVCSGMVVLFDDFSRLVCIFLFVWKILISLRYVLLLVFLVCVVKMFMYGRVFGFFGLFCVIVLLNVSFVFLMKLLLMIVVVIFGSEVGMRVFLSVVIFIFDLFVLMLVRLEYGVLLFLSLRRFVCCRMLSVCVWFEVLFGMVIVLFFLMLLMLLYFVEYRLSGQMVVDLMGVRLEFEVLLYFVRQMMCWNWLRLILFLVSVGFGCLQDLKLMSLIVMFFFVVVLMKGVYCVLFFLMILILMVLFLELLLLELVLVEVVYLVRVMNSGIVVSVVRMEVVWCDM